MEELADGWTKIYSKVSKTRTPPQVLFTEICMYWNTSYSENMLKYIVTITSFSMALKYICLSYDPFLSIAALHSSFDSILIWYGSWWYLT